jgi:hypothetical protein
MEILVKIDDVKVELRGSSFGSIRDTTESLISHCVREALRAYEESRKIVKSTDTQSD